MVKMINLPEIIYKDLASISEELSFIAKKSISIPMAISLIIAVYRAHLSNPCARDVFRQKIASLDFMSPEDFEKTWDILSNNSKETTK
jgi:hypothetical protein